MERKGGKERKKKKIQDERKREFARMLKLDC